jgi:hypothetical protein
VKKLSCFLMALFLCAVGVAQAAPVGSCFNPIDYEAKATANDALSSSGAIVFDTDALTMNGLNHGILVTNQSGNVVLAFFPYSVVDIQSGATVTVQGNRGLGLGSTSDMIISATVTNNGLIGETGGTGIGGNGGSGGDDGIASTSYNCTNQTATRAKGGAFTADPGKGYGGGADDSNQNGKGNGGGYGGDGGDGNVTTGGPSYGDAPLTNFYGGSGGSGSKANVGSSGGGGGGGAIQLTASYSITIGAGVTIGATGGDGGAANWGAGGGSGGAILLCAPKVTQNGTLNASGGNGGGSGGGGGGGRIAIYANNILGAAAYNVSAGSGGDPVATNGTYHSDAYPLPVSYRGTVITVR